MTGNIDMGNNNIVNVDLPVNDNDTLSLFTLG